MFVCGDASTAEFGAQASSRMDRHHPSTYGRAPSTQRPADRQVVRVVRLARRVAAMAPQLPVGRARLETGGQAEQAGRSIPYGVSRHSCTNCLSADAGRRISLARDRRTGRAGRAERPVRRVASLLHQLPVGRMRLRPSDRQSTTVEHVVRSVVSHQPQLPVGSSPTGRLATGRTLRAAPELWPGRQTRRRSVAQRVSWWRLESCSLRSTLETWVSTVLIEMNSSRAISLYA